MGKDFKKHHRPKFNNFNPHNKLQLNKYHQLGGKSTPSQSHLLHKKKRDLQRAIRFRQEKNQQIDDKKIKELETLKEQLQNSKKGYEKKMRKQFFIKSNYKQIMEIQMRKINKKIKKLKNEQKNQSTTMQLIQWEKKQRYIKFYPKNLKYVSLFPSTKPLEQEAINFQNKIMNDIEEDHQKILAAKNRFKSQESGSKKNKQKNKDSFFLEVAEEEQESIEDENEDDE